MKHIHHSLKYLLKALPYLLIFLGTLALIFLHKIDLKSKYNVLIFFGWFVMYLSALVFALHTYLPTKLSRLKTLATNEWIIVTCVIITALVTRSFMLGHYPYVTIGDELRDAGLNGLNMKIHPPVDIFAFGSYEGYGNFIPFISYIFSFIFSNTRYSYIVPSTIVGILSIMTTYCIGRKIGGRIVGFAAAIFLIGSLHHMHYSRTELLVVMDSLLAPLIILSAYAATRSQKGFLLFGLAAGLTLHFYAGVRGIVLGSALYVFIYAVSKIFHAAYSDTFEKTVHHITYYLVAAIIFCVGFAAAVGPTFNIIAAKGIMTDTGNRQIIFKKPEFASRTTPKKITFASKLYEKSFLVYFANPLGSHFPNHEISLLAFPVNWLFLIGIAYILLNHKKNGRLVSIVLLCVLIVPLTNQVIINDIGSDHRLMSILPLLNIFAALGLVALVEARFPSISTLLVGGITGLFIVTQVSTYFINRPSDMMYDLTGTKEYVLQTMIEYTKKLPEDRLYYVVNDSPHNYDFMHYIEKMDYLMYPKQMRLLKKPELDNLEFLIKSQEKPISILYADSIPKLDIYKGQTVTMNCSQNGILPNYQCPLNWTVNYSFNIAEIN